MSIQQKVRTYFFPMLLVFSIVLGGLAGCFFKQDVQVLKPFGNLFLNLIFIAVVPLIFFSVSSAVARAGSVRKLGRIFFYMMVVFVFTGLIAALLTLLIVKLFPLGLNVSGQLAMPEKISAVSLTTQMMGIFTVSDFSTLFSHEHMLALILFSILIGLATSAANDLGKRFVVFLQAGEEVFIRVFSLIMYYAPIGFFSYFAVLVSDLGPSLMDSYLRIAITYYGFALAYFVFASTFYAYLAGKMNGIRLFWRNIFLPVVTSLATCSSAASIPANLIATKKMGVAPEIYETVVPLGGMIHKDGSVIGGMIKIAFLFGMFHLDFSGTSVLLTAIGVSLLVGTVMGAIPSGGMLGELLILSIYGFPRSALMVIAAISIIIDPLATMLNVTGNSVGSMMVARLVEGRKWLRHH